MPRLSTVARTCIAVTAAIVAVLGIGQSPAVVDPAKKGYVLTFSDEFDRAGLDKKKWIDSYPDGARTHGPMEQQFYDTKSSSVKDSILTLKADKAGKSELRRNEGKPYTSGMITSFGKFAQQYGWFEIRAKLPKGKGVWPAFWLLPASKAWPPEIDVVELVGHDPLKVHMTVHWKNADGSIDKSNKWFEAGDFSLDFHTFAVEWTPKEIVWYVDGIERHRTTEHIPHEPFYILANLAIGNGGWPQAPDATTAFPVVMQIDYIRAYRLPAGGAK
jgi:beta-glucanase (GH16 family)